jgi:hypothetical protein
MEKTHVSLGKVIKAVASSEPHNLLQYFFFNYAQKEEELAALHQQNYALAVGQTNETLDNWTKKLILPMRVRICCFYCFFLLILCLLQDVIQDHVEYQKSIPANFPSQATTPNVNNNNNIDDPYTPNALLIKSLLPIHAKLFEKHRLQEFKSLFRGILRKEIEYHAVALESYSQLMECLTEIEEQEVNNWNNYYSVPTSTTLQQPRSSENTGNNTLTMK